MKRIYIYLAFFALILMMGCKATAQKFTSHAVKEGETLQSVAKDYGVTPYGILQFNKEIKQGDALRPNTILVIPAAGKLPSNRDNAANDSIREPIGFTSHRARKRETLYGIAQKFNISEDDIKRYNTELYASQLKKGMTLKIPQYKELSEDGDGMNPEDFETYVVQPKETRWSIAHKYGITIDSLLTLNPDLPTATNYLAIGQELKLPKIAGSTVEEVEVQLYESYTVPPKKTLYSLSREYGIKGEEIVRLNPEIGEQGGLKEGMVIRLPKRKTESGEVNTENFAFYEVKPKQTEFSLTRKLGISWSELVSLNPDLSQGLKAGMVLKLPVEKTVNLEVKNSLVLDKINLLDSINTLNRPKLMFLFPFRLDKINFGNKEKAEGAIARSNAINYSLGLYSGALVAIDSLASLGISIDVKTYDTRLDLERTKEILRKENMANVNAIVGPLELNSLKEVAVQAADHQVPVIAPLASGSDLSLTNVFFSIPSDEVLRERMLGYVSQKDTTAYNMIVIADAQHKMVADTIVQKFPGTKLVEVKEEEKNMSIDIEKFTELLSEEKENWVFVESNNFQLVSSVTSILNSAITPKIRVRMLTTNKNRAFENDIISGSHLSNLKFTYPSADRESGGDAFESRYRKRWGSSPDRYATRGFDLTYDLLLKLAYQPDLFKVSEMVGLTEYSGNKFNYTKDLASGYFNTSTYIMMYEDMYIKEVKP